MKNSFLSSILVAIISLHLLQGGLSYGQEEVRQQLEGINTEIEQTKLTLRDIARRQEIIKRDLATMQEQISLLKEIETRQQSDLQVLGKRLAKSEVELSSLESQRTQALELSKKRARILFIHQNEPIFFRLANNSGNTAGKRGDLLQSAYFLSIIRRHDFESLSKLVELQSQTDERRKELKGLIEQQKLARSALSQQSESIRVRLDERQKLVQQLSLEKQGSESELLKLRAQALRFETVLTSLMSGADDRAELNLRQPKYKSSRAITEYDGPGLLSQKGKLVRPVKGKIIQGFGSSSSSGLDLGGPSKGLELAADESQPVQAVAAGKLVYVGNLPRLGAVVIVDHGKRSYSLYGRLADSKLALGADIEKGQEIATLAPADTYGRNLYFELRVEGKPVDPSKLIKFK